MIEIQPITRMNISGMEKYSNTIMDVREEEKLMKRNGSMSISVWSKKQMIGWTLKLGGWNKRIARGTG